MPPVALQQSRTAQIERLTGEELDVLVVGGGIVGAGIARDAAMRGLHVGLVEQHDLAFGTSSRSSRLLHGGLRYLAQGRIGLVREGSREKRVLSRIAPHLAEPLPFVFPTYRQAPWPLWKLRVGVKLYDLLCGGQNLGPSSSMSASELVEHLPGINPEGLTGGVRYFDGLTNDSRLVLDTLRSAARHGAVISNYTRLENASPCPAVGGASGRPRRGVGWECELRDLIADRAHRLVARTVVNATGPWADKLPHSRVRLRLTKGVHLVIDRRRLPVPEAVVMTHQRRILFAIPWGERVILGTTDTDYDGPIEDVRTEPADVDYILGVVGATFPQAGLSEADVISTWAGLRPLIASGHGGPSDISRAHQIRMAEPGWLDVAGGKLTTYRLIAEQAVDRLQKRGHSTFSRRHAPPRPASGDRKSRMSLVSTAEEPLLPAEEVEGLSGILPPPLAAQVVEHYCRNEWAVHLEDVMLRRAGWHYYLTDADQVAQQVAGWMAETLGWGPSEREAELTGYRRIAC